jgi:hypothetical protein
VQGEEWAMQRICGIRDCGAQLGRGAISRNVRLCAPCRELLASRLARLPRLYQACEHVLEARRYHSIRVARGRRPAGICLDEVTVAVRSDTIRVLSSWCGLIVDERGVTGPREPDIALLASFLRAHLDWLVTHPAAPDFAAEIAHLITGAGEVLNPARARVIDLGPCIEEGCAGMVRTSFRPGNQGSAPQVRCDAGHSWPPHLWLRLCAKLNPPGHRQLNPPGEPAVHGVSA